MYVYKIRSKEGTFSTGSATPSFTKKGQSWTSRGHLINHLLRFKKEKTFNKYYSGCEVVRFNLEEDAVVSLDSPITNSIAQFREVFDATGAVDDAVDSTEAHEALETQAEEREVVMAAAEGGDPKRPW